MISHNDVRKKHTSLCLWIKTGSVRELATNNGIAHLLEHSLFGQYSKNQRSRVYEEIKNNGLKIRAFTTVENTAFFIEHIKNCLKPNILFLEISINLPSEFLRLSPMSQL